MNLSTDDGWIPEFAKNGVNGFVVPQADYKNASVYDQDNFDLENLYNVLENEILPMYYDRPDEWRKIQHNAMEDVKRHFNSDRIANEYYKQIYALPLRLSKNSILKSGKNLPDFVCWVAK